MRSRHVSLTTLTSHKIREFELTALSWDGGNGYCGSSILRALYTFPNNKRQVRLSTDKEFFPAVDERNPAYY